MIFPEFPKFIKKYSFPEKKQKSLKFSEEKEEEKRHMIGVRIQHIQKTGKLVLTCVFPLK